MPLTGSCSCGAVKFELLSAPMFIHCCHCLLCQKQTGGAFVINALIETDRIVLSAGKPAPISIPTESGRPHDVYRCNTCGVAVWSDYGRRPALRFVRVSALEQRHQLVPDAHLFTRSKVPWVTLPPGARAFSEFYELEEEWPAESLARRKAILG